MPFKYACFISYPHADSKQGRRIIEQLTETLKDELALLLPEGVFLDVERLKPGVEFNELLARDLCQSICMIVVYMPIYECHPYCNREFTAMERLVEKRKELIGKKINSELGMIIPVIVRGEKDIPSRINKFQYCDISRLTITTHNPRERKEYKDMIKKIADAIFDYSKIFKQLEIDMCNECDSFEIPPENQCPRWRDELKEQSHFPFHESK